jgi:3-isopropylmalate dehydratase small subunit
MTLKNIRSKVLRIYPPDTNTDEVISGKYKYDELDLKKLAVHAFESIDPTFYADAQKVKKPILVAANNFGCGSSREQAPQVIRPAMSRVSSPTPTRGFSTATASTSACRSSSAPAYRRMRSRATN